MSSILTSCFSMSCIMATSSSGRDLNLSSPSARGRNSRITWTTDWNSSAWENGGKNVLNTLRHNVK